MDRWTEIELFLNIVEKRGLSKAGEAMDMSKAAVSRHLASLEARLGARLIERNSRNLHVTEAGQQFFERCKLLHNELQEVEKAVNSVTLQPKGKLTITSSLSFAMLHLGPLLPKYHELYPDVVVNIVAANRYVDLIESGIDLAIRTREFEPDSSITIRKLATTRRVLAASPQYLARRGTPRTLEDLHEHSMLQYSLSNRPDELHFRRDGMERVIRLPWTMVSNDGQIIRAAALAGHGILVQPRYIIYDDLVAGRLLPLLDEFSLPDLTINIAYPSQKYLSAKCRTFMDFLLDHFRKMDYEKKWMA
ncbi:LysR family transcriptional regulator [Ramlibacter sp. 2FC]|uniref:LysR family transcriptional regulator n=1 Tax=Ramlibacter sp. 2FC TaxID=2502188 RepID=UPI0010F949EB|nr:LysR family transcriptional regulator [Ramlibacter sp. 2FC]